MWALVLLLVAATPDEEAAKQHFKEASEHYQAGRLEAALTHYTKAHELLPLPAFLFNMAQCHRRMESHARAAELYQRYLDEEPNPPDRRLVEDLLAEARRKAAEQAVESGPAPGTTSRITATAPVEGDAPIYETWWFWTIVGGAVVVVAVSASATAVALSGDQTELPETTLGVIDAR